MKLNSTLPHNRTPAPKTHEGTPGKRQSAYTELRRRVLTALLWENTFYESGSTVANSIAELVPLVEPEQVVALAWEARNKFHLRHVPLFLVRELARIKDNGSLVADALENIIQRADELTEFLAIYWQGQNPIRRDSLSAGVKRGLRAAFGKFDEYQLAKYNRASEIKLRDVLQLVHPKPVNRQQSKLWKRLLEGTLETPDTWESNLTSGADKRDTFERLMRGRNLGGLAFLRNLRNMIEARVDRDLIRRYFDVADFERTLPFRFVAAANHAPIFEREIEQAMFGVLSKFPRLLGTTALVIDTSPSMEDKLSEKSELTRLDAASALAMLTREICERANIYTFNNKVYKISRKRGFALRDAITATMANASCGGYAVKAANDEGYDRIIVLTDGQWHYMRTASGRPDYSMPFRDVGLSLTADQALTVSPPPLNPYAYMVNLAPLKTGVSPGTWHAIDGFSEAVLQYIVLAEQEGFLS